MANRTAAARRNTRVEGARDQPHRPIAADDPFVESSGYLRNVVETVRVVAA